MTRTEPSQKPESELIPSTLKHPRALHFWLAILLTGVATGIGAVILTELLEFVQHVVWQGSPTDILEAAQHAGPWRHIFILLGAAAVTGFGQKLLTQLSSGNGIDTTEAIWSLGCRLFAFLRGKLPLDREGDGIGIYLVRANLAHSLASIQSWEDQVIVACESCVALGVQRVFLFFGFRRPQPSG